MKRSFLTLLLLVYIITGSEAAPNAGFFLPDSLTELTIRYKTANNLIILPVRINDSLQVNLILDTGCRNMILFGRRFDRLLKTEAKTIEFSGLGSGNRVKGKLALNNHVSIDAVNGYRIPIIVVPEKNLFSHLPNVHGVIGYEIFIKFEIEINFPKQQLTFRSAFSHQYGDFRYVPMNIVDARPFVPCSIVLKNAAEEIRELLIDTGSSLGLIVCTGEEDSSNEKTIVGIGLNGDIKGSSVVTKKLQLGSVEFPNVNTSIIYERETYASIGIDVLKDYTVVLNYAKAYAGFRKERAG